MFHFHYNCSTDLSLRALIFLCMANNCVCVWLWIIFQTTMKAETVTWYINIVLSFILGEVQWVNHRYVPHASSFGEGTSKPGHTDLQARNDGECQAHRVVVIMGKPPSFLLYHLSMLAQTVWKPSTDALSSGISWLIHDSVKHIRLLWVQASAVGSCSLFASDLTFPIILHGRLSLKLFIAWSLHCITVSLVLFCPPPLHPFQPQSVWCVTAMPQSHSSMKVIVLRQQGEEKLSQPTCLRENYWKQTNMLQ